MAKMINKQRKGFESGAGGSGGLVNLNDSKISNKKNCSC